KPPDDTPKRTAAAVTKRSHKSQLRRSSPYRADLQPERHWPVVSQRHLHVRAKLSGFDNAVLLACPPDEIVEQSFAFLRLGRRAETRARALARLGSEGELR